MGAIGLQNVTHAKLNAVDIGVIGAGCGLSLMLGLLRGHVNKVSMVNGSPFMSWSAASVAVFAVNVLPSWPSMAAGLLPGAPRPR